MYMSNKDIKTTHLGYPQIYAYVTPNAAENRGWVKIGYTEQQDVDKRIAEQAHTISIETKTLWHAPAKFRDADEQWFIDKDLHKYLVTYKNRKRRHGTEWFYYGEHPEQSYKDFESFLKHDKTLEYDTKAYTLRKEQTEAVEQTMEYFNNHQNGKFLWNAKPRFGKTLTTYDLARKMNADKVLVLTNRPAVGNSWFDDYEKFIAGPTSFAFVSTSDSLKHKRTMTREEYDDQIDTGRDKMIAFISLQDLKGSKYFGGGYEKLGWVKQLAWDLVVVDESHEGVDTSKTKLIFDNIECHATLYLSGTPFKAIASHEFNEDQIFNWTYADEQQAKQNWHGDEYDNPYRQLPRLNMFSYQMSRMITDEVEQGADIDGENIDYAFDLNEFFKTNDGKFIHESAVKKWLDTLSKNEKYPFSTPDLRNELKHTLWLLQRVDSAKALQKLLKKHPVFENYKVVLAAGNGNNDDDNDLKGKAYNQVTSAIKNNDKTITLSVGQLTTGVTIPQWTAVLMLSNMQSASAYMQAAFRAQNPWQYFKNENVVEKQNAYVFDFAPERTLIMYDELANDLFKGTTNGSGTTAERKENIKQLLNFFPVIAEDAQGKMAEIDVNQVLTIPRTIKAQEVVKRGFMSNLLFQNISGIFAANGAEEILNNLKPAKENKRNNFSLPKDIKIDNNGEVEADKKEVSSTTEQYFGNKVYGDLERSLNDTEMSTSNTKKIIKDIKKNLEQPLKDIAKEKKVSATKVNNIIKKHVEQLKSNIESTRKQSKIDQSYAARQHKLATDKTDDNTLSEQAQKQYNDAIKLAKEKEQEEIKKLVNPETISESLTEEVIKSSKNIEKNDVEDDVRARLRGFARTIPSFLMAYGDEQTTLASFDKQIKDDVFKEVTGITLSQFATLRDTYHFFDETVFNESVQEFMKKRKELSNYFDEGQSEDIFDYIPAQKTNQIFTPKRVVKMMVDALEQENPDIFTNPDKTFADLYMKSGLYITEIIKRLYVGLKSQIPDNDARLKHIIEHQVYGFAPTEIIYHIAHNYIFGFDAKAKKIDDSHIVYLDTTPYAEGKGDLEAKCDELFGGNE
jgi:type II restriction enzyme